MRKSVFHLTRPWISQQLRPARLQVLHLVRAQCTNSSLVTIVKVVERCFSDGFTVRFEMYDAAPASPPAPLPYFNKPDGTLITDEIELGKYLAGEGCASLLDGDAAAMASLFAESNALAKPVKIATKSKTAEVGFLADRSPFLCSGTVG